MRTLVCFESDAQREQFRLAFPKADTADWLTAAEWVARALGSTARGESERLSAFGALLTEEARQHAARWYHTIGLLRQAMILSHDDADFAFASLPATPRNRELGALLHRYLDSPLGDDETARRWRLVENIKSFSIDAPAPRLVFVRATESAPLFGELARAYRGSPSAEEVLDVESWQWQPEEDHAEPSGRRPLVVWRGTPPALLEALGRHADHALVRGRAVRIVFGGEERERAFLLAYFAHRRVAVRSLLPRSEARAADGDPTRDLLRALRQDPSRDLKTRLKWIALLNADARNHRRCRDAASLTSYLTRFARLKQLPPDELSYVQALVTAPPPPRQHDREPAIDDGHSGVLLLPFHPLPMDAVSTTLVYAGRNLLAPPERASWLAESEAEALHRAGFPIQRASHYRARMLERLNALAMPAAGTRSLYSALDDTALPFHARLWPVHTAPTPAVEEAPIRLPGLPARALSATQLEAYAACPAAYFFSYTLRWRRFESAEDSYALIFGQATHLALERFFKSGSHDYDALPRHFTAALADLAPALETDLPLVTTLHAHFARLAKRVPEVEEQLRKIEGAVRPTFFERQFELDFSGVRLIGKIDRVDRMPGGNWVVLDYKTGSVDFTPDHVARGLGFQALIYLLAAESLGDSPCAGVLFYDLKKGEIRRGMLREDLVGGDVKKALTRGHVMPKEKFDRLKAEGMARLRELATAIAQGDFPAAPSAEACARCDYALYCRRSAVHG